MDLISGISATTEGLKLVNELRKIDKELDKAELKLRLVELADKLLDAKQALQDAQEREVSLKRQLEALTDKLAQKANLQDENGLLFQMDESGSRGGEPYCNKCYVKEEKLFRLRHFPAQPGVKTHYRCDNCTVVVVTGPSLPFPNTPRRNFRTPL